MAHEDYLEQEAEGRRLFSEQFVETIPLRLGRTLEDGIDRANLEDTFPESTAHERIERINEQISYSEARGGAIGIW